MTAAFQDEANSMDEHEFAALFTRMSRSVFTFAARRLSPEQAKDVVSETFEVIWRKRADAPPEPNEWPAWVVGVARNKVLQELQRVGRKHHDNRFVEDHPLHPDATSDLVADAVVDSLLARTVYAALTPAEKELFDMALLREITPSEGADLLGISVTAYANRLWRLRRRITTLHLHNFSADEGVTAHDDS